MTGSGHVEYKLAERRHPTRADLNAAVPDRPAVIYHTSLHACVLNSAALREAGFADGQPDPPDGAFGRDGQGMLTGVLFEWPMFAVFGDRLRHDLARTDSAARARVVRRAGQQLAALGITAACDADMRRQCHAYIALKSPSLIPFMNVRHSLTVNVAVGPDLSRLSRTTRRPSSVAVSIH